MLEEALCNPICLSMSNGYCPYHFEAWPCFENIELPAEKGTATAYSSLETQYFPTASFILVQTSNQWNWKLCDQVYGGSRCDKTVELVSTFGYEYQIFLPHNPLLWKLQTH